jgi:CBS domain-containing protein
MKVKDVMTMKVISIEPNATVMKAARLMLQRHISGLPVVTPAGELVGIVTEGDFLRRTEIGTRRRRSLWHDILSGSGKVADEYVHAHGRLVHEVMTLDPVTITEDADLTEVVDLMEKRSVKRLPVMRGKALVGIVSRANLMRAFATMGSLGPALATDEEIREQLVAQLDKENWAPVGTIEINVRDGVVHYWGMITDERVRTALIAAAENTPGVKEVRDHLSWLEPYSGIVFN